MPRCGRNCCSKAGSLLPLHMPMVMIFAMTQIGCVRNIRSFYGAISLAGLGAIWASTRPHRCVTGLCWWMAKRNTGELRRFSSRTDNSFRNGSIARLVKSDNQWQSTGGRRRGRRAGRCTGHGKGHRYGDERYADEAGAVGNVLCGLGARGLSRRQELRPGGLGCQGKDGKDQGRARHGRKLWQPARAAKLNRSEGSAKAGPGDPDHQRLAGSGGDRGDAVYAIRGESDQHAAIARRGLGPAAGQELKVAALIA